MGTGEPALTTRGGHQASAYLGHIRPHCAATVHVPRSPVTWPDSGGPRLSPSSLVSPLPLQ